MTQYQQKGIALVTSMIILMVITMLAVTGMATSRLGLIMAGNMQFREQAFQAAEAGIERRFLGENYGSGAPITETVNTNFSVTTTVEYKGPGPVQDSGFSLGTDFLAHHFRIESDALGNDAVSSAQANLVQGLYFIGPGT